MRIITGSLKGRTIPVPDTGELRPTADRTKEAIFSIIDARRFLEGMSILDLFAGTGNLGFEAISRGAERVTAVERNVEHTRLIERLGREFGVEKQLMVITESVDSFLKRTPQSPYHIIFADPPYDYPGIEEMVTELLVPEWLTDEGWFILEHDKRHQFESHDHCIHSKAYGRTTVSIFERP